MTIADWLTQIRRGLLEYCILTMIRKERVYGYDLIARLNSHEPFSAVAAGTVYPLLKRLEKETLISYSWENSAEGLPPKKFYQLTEQGEFLLALMDIEWGKVLASVENIKEGAE